jgi:hypothetical protein
MTNRRRARAKCWRLLRVLVSKQTGVRVLDVALISDGVEIHPAVVTQSVTIFETVREVVLRATRRAQPLRSSTLLSAR